MNRLRLTAMGLALSLSLSLLPACGRPNPPAQSAAPGSSSQQGSGSSAPDASTPDASTPDVSTPDASTPDVSTPDASAPDVSTPDASAPDASAPDVSAPDASAPQDPAGPEEPAAEITLNKTDFTLFKTGDSYRLRYTRQPDCDGIPVWTSSDDSVAAVDQDGTVTAAGPGTALVTVECCGASASCTVRCKFTQDPPDPGSSGPSQPETPPESGTAPDLAAFYQETSAAYEFPFMTEADQAALQNYFAGLSDISLTQSCIYLCGMMPAPTGDMALVQVADEKEVDAVKAIFQARIDYMVGDGNGPGGAWYPGPTEMWQSSSRIVSNGTCVMLIASEKCDEIAEAFNALFR